MDKSAAGEIRRGEFIELAPPAPASYTPAGTPECILELEDPCGAKMRVCQRVRRRRIWPRSAGASGALLGQRTLTRSKHDPAHAASAEGGLVAVEPVDFRKGIDGLARLCKDVLQQDPFRGWVFVFRNHRATAVKILVYDGQGFWNRTTHCP